VTGITDAMKADYKVMNALAEFTRLKPYERFNYINKFSSSLASAAE